MADLTKTHEDDQDLARLERHNRAIELHDQAIDILEALFENGGELSILTVKALETWARTRAWQMEGSHGPLYQCLQRKEVWQ